MPITRDLEYPALDGIRFYAVSCVFVQHVLLELLFGVLGMPRDAFVANSPSLLIRFLVYLQMGDHGVDVFFLISGFLMARIVLRPGSTYVRFIRNRVLRIYPAFLVSLVIATVIDITVFSYEWNLWEFAKNVVFLNAVPGAVAIEYNFVSWSLGYEFAFYLVIPLLAFINRVVDRRIAAGALLIGAIFLAPNIRFIALFLGAVIGAFDDATLARTARKIPLLLALAPYLLLNALWPLHVISFETFYPPFIVSAAVLLTKVVWDDRSVLHRVFVSKPLRFLGTLSYSIYLYHATAASLSLRLLSKLGLLGSVPALNAALYLTVALTATFALSYLSYRVIEQRYFNSADHRRRTQEQGVRVERVGWAKPAGAGRAKVGVPTNDGS